MAKCPNCGADLKKGQKFCTKCGTKIKQKEYQELSPETEAKIDILKKKIKSDGLNTKLYLELGDIYRESKRLNDALSQYQKAINIEESNFEAHLKSGDVYFDLKELDKAKKSYLNALKLDEDSLEAKFGLFKVYYTLGEYENALDIGEELKERTPENIELYQKLSDIHIEIGQKEKALIEFKQIKELCPDDISVLLEIGYLYQDKDDFNQALNYFQEVLKKEPDNNEANFKIGETFCIIENYEETIKYLSDIINKLSHKKKEMARLYLAKAYIESDQKDKALDELAEADSISNSELKKFQKKIFADLYYKCGLELLENRKLIAKKYLKKSTQLDPQNQDYKNEYEKAIKDQKIAKQESKKKIKSTLITIFSILVILFLGWYLGHGKIFINITPKTASVFIDGEKLKKDVNHYTTSSLFFGNHKVRIAKEGYEDWEKKVKVGFGKTTNILADLQPIYGGLMVSTQPSGAEVYIDNYILPTGKTPLKLNKIIAKKHKIKIKLKGYIGRDTSLNIRQNEITKCNFKNFKGISGLWELESYKEIGKIESGREADIKIHQQGNNLNIKKIKGRAFYSNKFSGKFYSYRNFKAHGIDRRGDTVRLKGTISDNWDEISGTEYRPWMNTTRNYKWKLERNK